MSAAFAGRLSTILQRCSLRESLRILEGFSKISCNLKGPQPMNKLLAALIATVFAAGAAFAQTPAPAAADASAPAKMEKAKPAKKAKAHKAHKSSKKAKAAKAEKAEGAASAAK
jgi:hypothetical protein